MNKKLKIATVIPPHVSMSSSYLNLAKVYSYMVKKFNIEITIFVDRANFKFPNLKIKKITGIDSSFGLYKILFFFGLPRFYYPFLVRDLKGYDVIESSTPEFYIYALQSYHAARKYNKKLVLRTGQTKYDFFLFPYTKTIALHFARNACNFASRLCFTNPASRNAYIKIGLIDSKSDKIRLLGHAIDTTIFKPMNLRKDKSKIILLSVGALYKLKGHQNIIKALKKLIDKGNKNLELWVVGSGKYKLELWRLAEQLGIKEKIKFLGAQDHEKLAKIYNMSDIFVLGNLHDVTPAVSEAMLCNVPVVASRCGGVDYVIPSKNHGIITKWNDPDDLAKGIEVVIRNKKLRENMVKNARKHILDNFSIEKIADKLYDAYTK